MNSLVITDKEKYGNDSPCCSPVSGSKGKDKVKKYAPTVELTGSQVTALGLDAAQIGESGTATISFVVKSVRAGESYGDEVVTKTSPAKVTIQLMAGEPSDAAADTGEAEESDEEESKETPDEEAAEAPAKDVAEKVSPGEAFAEDDDGE